LKLLGSLIMRRVLIALALSMPFAAIAQMSTPEQQADAVRAAFAGCVRGQFAKMGSAQASIEIIEKYCVCFANKTASEFEANRGLMNKRLFNFAEVIGNECKAELGLR
jgi:hypothetical protein